MTRNREKKALYEVISKSWSKPGHDKALEQRPREESGKDKQSGTNLPQQMPGSSAAWLNRPRMLQFNAGRVEISVPYQLAIAVLLGLVLLALIVFRLGQVSYRSSQKAAETPVSIQVTTPKVMAGTLQTTVSAEEKEVPVANEVEVEKVEPKGTNRIVIQTYQLRADLEPVRRYFSQFGIETEIIKIGDWYYLVTRDGYENPSKPWTDGYIAKQKIIELGANYEAPQGYETFGSKPFSDAYGMRFDE